MSGDSKKYNVWIAYSDLFTNLSTFLFISAIGVFAALGSGLLAPPGGGGSLGCNVPKTVQQRLEADGSLLKKTGSAVRGRNSGARCTEYYVVREYRFRTPEANSFTDGKHRPPSQADLQSRICLPIWLTLASPQFEDADGMITFVGISQPNDGQGYPASCGARRRDDTPIADFPRGRRPIFVISDCRLRGVNAYRPLCQRVRDCLATTDPEERSTWCQSVWDVDERARQADAACRRAPAHEQARTLSDQCEGIDWQSQDQEFRRQGMRAIAQRSGGRSQIWGQETDYRSVTRETLNRTLPANHPLSTLPPGSMVVQIQYGG